MTVGTVQWFDVRKGYGFLKADDGGGDVLVSICALERAGMASLNQGQRLSFVVVRDERIARSCAESLSTSGLQASLLDARRHDASPRGSRRSIATGEPQATPCNLNDEGAVPLRNA
jgi:cold shock protein